MVDTLIGFLEHSYLAKETIDVSVVLGYTLNERIELLDEASDLGCVFNRKCCQSQMLNVHLDSKDRTFVTRAMYVAQLFFKWKWIKDLVHQRLRDLRFELLPLRTTDPHSGEYDIEFSSSLHIHG